MHAHDFVGIFYLGHVGIFSFCMAMKKFGSCIWICEKF